MIQTDILESTIIEELTWVGTCTIDELNERLPYYSLNQVFFAVDRLTREGTVALKHLTPFSYLLSLAPRRSAEPRRVTPV